MTDTTKHVLDAAAAANVVATLVGLLPSIAAGLSVIWLGIQLYTWFKTRPDLRR